MSTVPQRCTLEMFRSWLYSVRKCVTERANGTNSLVKSLVEEQSTVRRELEAISQQSLAFRREVARRARKLESMGLGWLRNFPPVKHWIERPDVPVSLLLLKDRERLVKQVSDLENRIIAAKKDAATRSAEYLAAARRWEARREFANYSHKEYESLLAHELVDGIFLADNSWLCIVTKPLTCAAMIGLDVEVVRLGNMQISLCPGEPVQVRNLTYRPKGFDAQGIERTWEAPHVRADAGCFKDRRDDLLVLDGDIHECIKQQISALQSANIGDGWGVPVLRLFPRAIEVERELWS